MTKAKKLENKEARVNGGERETSEYRMVEAFSHLPTNALEDIIKLCRDYDLCSAIIRSAFRITAETALRQKKEASE
jgi:hypothetical protein